NVAFQESHPAEAKCCVKALGLIQKHYNPNRLKAPLKRTNPKKGVDEDPQFVEISWEEALDLLAEKLRAIQQKGLIGEDGYPRLATAEGSDGVCPAFYGTWSVLFGGLLGPGVWGPTDPTLGQGGGVKCYHTEHMLGEMWHKAFTCATDTPHARYILQFGGNLMSSGGVAVAYRHAEARTKGLKQVQVEPHLSVTGGFADEWIPIRPEGDAAFLYAMLHTVLHEMDWQKVCDIHFLKTMTNSPYLVGPNGYFLRDPQTRRPLIWDPVDQQAKIFDAEGIKDFALVGAYTVSGLVVGADGKEQLVEGVVAKPAFQLLIEHVRAYTPEWASKQCDVPAATIRRITREFAEHAMVGATITIDGVEMPWRPVNILLGKTVNNGWGSYQCVWASHVLKMLVGALEVPGSDVGNRVLLSGPPRRTEDGFMDYPFHPTDREHWQWPPVTRDGFSTLTPYSSHMGPWHLAWRNIVRPPENWPAPNPPEVWIGYKINPLISQFETDLIIEVFKKIPFVVIFSYTLDEVTWFADLVLPEDGDLESLQIFPVGGTTFFENFWDQIGFAIKQPVVERQGNTMNITDITTELADRIGLLPAYNSAINQGAMYGIVLQDTPYALEPTKKYSAEEIYDRLCRALTQQFSGGQVEFGLDWFKENGAFLGPFPKLEGIEAGPMYFRPWYLYPTMKKMGLRFELPYQERLKRVGEELGARLHEKGIHWWDKQVAEYEPLPPWVDTSRLLDSVLIQSYGKDPKEYPFWLVNTRSMQYAWGSNVGVPLMAEAARHVLGQLEVQINSQRAKELGIADGDEIWIESAVGKTKGRARVREGIHPDVLLTTQMFGQWVQPFAKSLGVPNLNAVAPNSIDLTDASGGSKDHVKVRIYKA
ncbi:MAG: molybdopterin-dependent oxidoreductase, partial [Anaerolineae bacterium]|nr:molybdopterin-dependent oxidoreductase [Anaerolineae bacterium]